ncbi:MAG: hypothetical protein PVJ84_10335 [Desulfobacteraceae bacterium]|jgi:hypothetical protein
MGIDENPNHFTGGTQMVKKQQQYTRQKRSSKGFNKNRSKARKINVSTHFETCTEQLSPFGGLLALIKFLDLIDFKQIFNFGYIAPTRKPKLGHYRMVVGLLIDQRQFYFSFAGIIKVADQFPLK